MFKEETFPGARDGACWTSGDSIDWYRRRDYKKCARLCAKCPVGEDCLQHALEKEYHGYWNSSPTTRVALRKELGMPSLDPGHNPFPMPIGKSMVNA